MPNHEVIYEQEASKYHQLIAKQKDVSAYIEEIRPYRGLDIVDLGAGTGRLTLPLAGKAKSIIALDASEAMLHITAERLSEAGYSNGSTITAEHRKLPLEDQSADLIVSGWSICYLCSSEQPDWQNNLTAVMGEIKRVLRTNGTIIIFETMGTGFDSPTPPHFLTAYYDSLVRDYGFSHKWIRTDYTFDSARQAEQLTRFFFSDELADRVAEQQISQLPECAGVWWLQL